MSLPSPNFGGSTMTMDPRKLQAMEAPLIALTNSAGGDLRTLLYAFFNFLHRRTDFYLVPSEEDVKEGVAKMGFHEGEAEKLLLAAFRQFPLRRIPRQKHQGGSASTASPQGSNANQDSKPNSGGKDNSDGANTATNTSTAPDTTASPSSSSGKASDSSKEQQPAALKSTKQEETSKGTIRYTEEGLQVPVGNGGTTKQYTWTQTIDECTVMIGLPAGTRAKELDVSIKPSSIHVKTKKQPGQEDSAVTTFVEGSLVEKIKPDESTWSLEGGVMIIILYKLKKTFWTTIIEGDEKIDTSLVDSRRHISEYDEATQGQLRKIMFDQKQQEKGFPTSDEITGKKTIPPMPPGVEYIDKHTFDDKKGNEKK